MRIGLLIPQGYFGEFDGWEPSRAWERVLAIALEAERRGFDSVWLGEHVLSKWNDRAPVFDCVTLAASIAAAVPRVEIGFTVVNSPFRNPAMTAVAPIR
jgi:alkanesulfonate monooxygenase SsuD/methylene tetrahydromethanopterin reductase-like flavin-dependent oxidoreductase (luciferase family)